MVADDVRADAAPPNFKVLYVSGVGGGARRCRVVQPMEQLALMGVPTGYRAAGDPGIYADALDHDVVVWHRVPYNPYVGDVMETVWRRGGLNIYETDDLVFRPDLIEFDSFYRHLDPEGRRLHEEHVAAQLDMLRRADVASTTTEFLAELLAAEGKPVLIHRNALGAEWQGWCDQARSETVKPPDQVVLGYVSGSRSHDYDFAEVADALAAVMARHEQVRLRVVGYLTVTPRLAPFRDRIEVVDFTPWERVPWQLAKIDINLAPLEQDNPYCNAKSELKYIEASALALPTVASRTQCFVHAIRSGENGCLAGDTAEWTAALDQLISDAGTRRRIGEAARADVAAHYTPEARGRELAAALNRLWRERPAPTRSEAPLDSARFIITRLGQHLADDEAWVPADPELLAQGTLRRREIEHRHLLRLELALRQLQRTPANRWLAQAKHGVKSLTGRRYRTRVDGVSAEVLPPLLAGRAVEQAFVATATGLCAVDVLVSTFRRVVTSGVRFELFADGDGDDGPVYVQLASGTVFQDTQYFTFGFPVRHEPTGHGFRVRLSSPDGVWGDTVALWRELDAVAGAGTGGLTQDGMPVPGRLAMRLRYCAG